MAWVEVDKTWKEFCDEVAPQFDDLHKLRGLVVEVQTDRIERLLIGDINVEGGFCDDCSIDRETRVLRMLDLRGLIKECSDGE